MINIFAAKNAVQNRVITKLAAEQRAVDIKTRIQQARQPASLFPRIIESLRASFR